MNNATDHTPITPESVLLAVKEMFAVSRAEAEAEAERRNAEFDKKLEKSREEAEQRKAEFDAKLEKSRAEDERRSAEFYKKLEESRAEFEKNLKESNQAFDRRMTKLDELVGGVSRNQGLFSEEYFINSLDKSDKAFFGEHFEKLIANYSYHFKSTQKKGEFDIVLINGTSVAIIEIKFKARKNDVQNLIKKVPDFREEFPNYQSHRIYLGLAAMAFEKDVDDHCISEGVAVLKQVGDTVVINDEHLKTF